MGGMSAAGAATTKFGDEAAGVQQRVGSGWTTMSKGLVAGVALIATALGASIGEAIKFESAFAGVRKTVDGSEADYKALEDGIVSMANRLPATREEIAGVAEAAGQLGVQKDSILDFTEVMIGLGSATNLTADEAATQLAQLMNIMGTAAGDVENLGSTLVALGNAGASTEKDILDMGLRIAGAGKIVGLTEAQVLALANGLASMGIQSQVGGSVISQVMTDIHSAVIAGGEDLAGFADVAGVSAEQFADKWRKDPAEALTLFVEGLGRVQASGGDVVGVLSSLGLKGDEINRVMLAVASGADTLTESLATGSEAWGENSALAEETAKRYETAESKLRILGNQITNVARIVGAALIPMLLAAISGLQEFGAWLAAVGGEAAGKLSGAWDDLSDTGTNLVRILAALWDAGAPVVTLLAQLGGGAAIGTLSAIASVLETVTGLLADHADQVSAVVAAYLVWRTVAAVLPLVQVGAAMATQAFVALQVAVATTGTVSLQAARGVGILKAALTATVATATVVTAGLAAFAGGAALAFMSLERSADHGRAAADRFIESLNVDESDTQSIVDAVGAINDQVQKLREETTRGGWTNFTQRINPFDKNTIDEANTEIDRIAEQQERLALLAKRRLRLARELSVDLPSVDAWIEKLNLDPATMSVKEMEEAVTAARGSLLSTAEAMGITGADANAMAGAVEDSTKAFQDQVDVATDLFEAQRKYDDATQGVTDAQDRLEEAHKAVADAERAAEESAQGVTDARRALQDATRGVEEAEKGVETALRGVETARRGVTDAEEAAEAARDDVVAATEALAVAEREAAGDSDAMRDALEGVTDAEDAVTRAQEDSLTAQELLTAARENYDDVLKNLARTAAGSADDVLSAEIRLRDAQRRLAELGMPDRNGEVKPVTADERLAAQIAIREAERALELAKERAEAARSELARQQAAGVEGSDAVVAARDAAAAAADAEAAANGRLEDAAQNVADVQAAADERLETAHGNLATAIDRVGDANQRVIDARQAVVDAQDGVRSATENVARAHERVRDAAGQVDAAQQRLIDSRTAIEEAQGGITTATRGVEDAYLDQATAAYEVDRKTLGAEEATKRFVERLGEVEAKLDPASPLLERLRGYRAALDALNGDFTANVNLGGNAASAILNGTTAGAESVMGAVMGSPWAAPFQPPPSGGRSAGPKMGGRSSLAPVPQMAPNWAQPSSLTAGIDYAALGAAVAASLPHQGPLVNVEQVNEGVGLDAVFRQAEFAARAA